MMPGVDLDPWQLGGRLGRPRSVPGTLCDFGVNDTLCHFALERVEVAGLATVRGRTRPPAFERVLQPLRPKAERAVECLLLLSGSTGVAADAAAVREGKAPKAEVK
jgi:hypothetical protein